MKKVIVRRVFGLAFGTALAIGTLTGCGNKEVSTQETQSEVSEEAATQEPQSETEEEVSTQEPQSETNEETEQSKEDLYPAVMDPALIHPGSLNSVDQSEETSDKWYENGDTDTPYYMSLTQMSSTQSDVGLDLTYWMIDGSRCLSSGGPLQREDDHAVVEKDLKPYSEGETRRFDLSFQDNFTCYNFETDTVWNRSHPQWGCKSQEWYDTAFAGNAAYRGFSGNSYQMITLNADHSLVETNDDDPSKTYTGHWEVKASNVIWLYYDDPEAAGIETPVDVTESLGFTQDGPKAEITGIWPIEFEIDENGVVTEFGVYPAYATDGSMSFESSFVFGPAEDVDGLKSAWDARKNADPDGQPEDVDDLSSVDWAAEPYFIVEKGDYDAAIDYNVALMSKDMDNKLIELHGTADVIGSSFRVVVEEDGTSHSVTLNVHVVDSPYGDGLPEGGTSVCVKGMIWEYNGVKMLVTDLEHIVEE